jgi:hypothetical protein
MTHEMRNALSSRRMGEKSREIPKAGVTLSLGYRASSRQEGQNGTCEHVQRSE